MATTRSAYRGIKARRAVDAREAVLFNGELILEILGWCDFVDLRRAKIVCSAVNKLDFTWLINLEAERRFKKMFPYAHWIAVKHPNPKISKKNYWIFVLGAFRKDLRILPTLTFIKNTRLAIEERRMQVQHNRMFFLIGNRLHIKVLFKHGFLQLIGMSWEGTQSSESNQFKFRHNFAQCRDLDQRVIYVTHIDRRPLNSFSGIKDALFSIYVKKLVSISFLSIPTNQWPLECRVPWNADWAGFNYHVITI